MFGKGEGWGDLCTLLWMKRMKAADLLDGSPIARTAGEGSMNLTKHRKWEHCEFLVIPPPHSRATLHRYGVDHGISLEEVLLLLTHSSQLGGALRSMYALQRLAAALNQRAL